LYEAEIKGITPAELLEAQVVAPDPLVSELVGGVGERLSTIDALLSTHSVGWPIERMPVVDRSVLRLATYELLARPDVSVAIVISQAVELAKLLSTADSSRFVNGVLGAVARNVR
jgi:N utilization substance protein B